MISQYTGTRVGTTATAADHATTGTFTRTSGFHGIIVGVLYNDDFLTNPIQSVVFGSDNLGFLAAQRGVGGNFTGEVWGVGPSGLTSNAATVTVSFTGGSSITIIVDVAEFSFVGHQGPGGVTNSNSGTTSPITVSLTSAASNGGHQGTITVAATDNAIYAIGGMYQPGLSSMTISSGTQIMAATTAGSGALEIQAASAWTQGTGGSDTISWTESLTRDWVAVEVEIEGAVLEGIIRAGGVLPQVY